MLQTLKKHVRHATALLQRALDNARLASKRDHMWPAVEKAWLRDHGTCAACGGTAKLQVHHKEPFHLAPEKELDRTNFITLCMRDGFDCHLRIGHGGNFRAFNPHVEKDAASALRARQTLRPELLEPYIKTIESAAKQARQFEVTPSQAAA